MADPNLNELTAEAKALNKELANLKKLLGEFSTPSNQFKNNLNTVKTSLATGNQSTTGQTSSTFGKGLPTPSQPNTVWSSAKNVVGGAATVSEVRSAGGTWTQAVQSGYRSMGGGPSAPSSGPSITPTSSNGGGGGGGMGGMLSSSIGMLQKASDIYGAVTAGGLQFAYNRIEGPTGNRNTALQIAQALAPNAGMMGMGVQDLFTGLAQRAPVLGSNADIIGTILAGQSVGAFMSGKNASKYITDANGNPATNTGIEGRSGFFESVRQMQLLTPGVAAGSMATSLANYIGNTQSQQMGQYLGQGAFTMVGKGGRYKSLAEWAESILKFLSEQRPGKAQGSTFGKDELMAQNFPGSNINAWFRMMGVPQDMVDYWWQYALANAGQPNPLTKELMSGGDDSQTEVLQANIDRVRRKDLGYERLRSTTQATRRDYLMGTQMYGLYGAREAADRRFNVGMQAADLTIGNLARTTNAGAAMAMLPTPIMEMLLPLMMKLASSPVGTAGSLIGGLTSLLGDPEPIGDPHSPVGDYGPRGSTSTAHLSPDLAKKVDSMMKANPRLKISSGYRDTVTQNRLHKHGVGRVGPASKSAHTRGWAVDIGPVSELGWVQANAGKFGLQTASHAGEPWHIQHEGTMPIGDNIFDIAKGALGSVAQTGLNIAMPGLGSVGGFIGNTLTGGGGPLADLIGKFITGGTMSSFIDTAISWFIKIMTMPLSGLAKAFGTRNITEEEINNLIDKPSTVKVNVSKYAGFTPTTNSAITGKNSAPIFGDPISMASNQPATVSAKFESPIIFQTQIHLSGAAGQSPIDAQKAASRIADALEAEYARREWRKS